MAVLARKFHPPARAAASSRGRASPNGWGESKRLVLVSAPAGWRGWPPRSSYRLMERLGMRREQHAVEDALHRSGAWLDSYGYALLDTEWAVRRQSMVTASPSSRTVSKPSRS